MSCRQSLVLPLILFSIFLNFVAGNHSVVAQQAVRQACEIQVIDASNGWPVPLVQLTTNHHVRFVSDNAGRIAFDLPELMNQPTWFSISGHGYGVDADGFGQRGVRLTPTPGGRLVIKVKRELAAKRLGRMTGAGLFAESQKLGLEQDWSDQGILGCDSVQNAVFADRMFWGWGDTSIASYPLGIFDMTGATTAVQPLDEFSPPLKLRYDYFADQNEKPRAVAPIAGSGPTWLGGYATVLDTVKKREQLVAAYAKIKPPLETYEHGLCVWDSEQKVFVKHKVLWQKDGQENVSKVSPTGHTVRWTDENEQEWLLFGDPLPVLKMKPTLDAWQDPKQWETLSPQAKIISRDGKELTPHRGSIAYSDYRKKWVCVFCQFGGDRSHLGELWYCEAQQPTGPWEKAIKVVTHDQYTFYNPKLHIEMTNPESPFLLFEATYTHTFSRTKVPTPRYEYNQILYRLDYEDVAEREVE